MMKKWKRPFSILKKRLPVCLRLRNSRKIELKVLMKKLKLLDESDTRMKTTSRICADMAGISAIERRKTSERESSLGEKLASERN